MQTELRTNKHKLKRLQEEYENMEQLSQNGRATKLDVVTQKKEELTKDLVMDVKILLYNNSERFNALYNNGYYEVFIKTIQ